MQSIMLKSKLHRATVTDVEPDYEGSLTIDSDLLAAVKMRPFEKILVANTANGERFETYAIAAEAGSKKICLNGATSHKGNVGDRIIIFTFAVLDDDALDAHKPLVLVLDENNDAPDGLKEM